jgi:aminoglycoside phosphotransferase (APT) family kinase protein
LADYGKPGNYFERQIGRWSKQYLSSVTQPIREMDALIEWLPANIPASALADTRPAIVHGDYHLNNMIFHPTEPRVLALADLSAEQAEQIRAEGEPGGQLVVTEVDIAAPAKA